MVQFVVNRKTAIVIAVVAGILLVAGIGALLNNNFHTRSKASDLDINSRKFSLPTQTTTPSEEIMVSYKDPLGFSLSYPQALDINNHPEDQENYANVEFLTADKKGSIRILVSDLPVSEILEKNVSFLDSKLGTLEAKKGILTDSNKMIMKTTWDGMLFKVEVTPADDKNLNLAADKILAKLTIPQTANYTDNTPVATTAPSDEEYFEEEEEVIE